MNTALWILQGLLGLTFLGAGALKLVVPREKLGQKMRWVPHFPPWAPKAIGLAEVAGAVGLVAPWATGIAPFLTPLAALCLVPVMIGAAVTHARLQEPPAPAAILAVLSALVAVGRSGLLT